MNKDVIGGITGTGISVVGTALQTNEVLQTISIILTIIGTLITICMGVTNWYHKAMKDDKIDKEELDELGNIISGGIKDIKSKKKGDKDE